MARIKVSQGEKPGEGRKLKRSERPVEIPRKRLYWLERNTEGELFVVLLFFDPLYQC